MQTAPQTRHESMVLVNNQRCVIGRCIHYPGKGWQFQPTVTNHGRSRKFWETASGSIPRWAMKIGDELLTDGEWKRERAG